VTPAVDSSRLVDSFDKRLVLKALLSARNGDFSARLPSEWIGLDGKISDLFNEIMVSNQSMERELNRVSKAVGKEGKIRQRVSFSASAGAWRGMDESVNTLISDLVWPMTDVTRSKIGRA